ncbi:MAG: hypothetical protein KDJ50_05860 [Alphaproteobacteria bacterium]|nr:hypothetical protein [Alphaproteobacteria bacterium]
MKLGIKNLKQFTYMIPVLGLSLMPLVSMSGQAMANALGDPAARIAGTGNGDGIAPVEAEVKAGEITVGSASQVVVKFRNVSSKDVQVGQINLYPSSTVSSEVALNECSSKEGLPSGAECAVVVSVKGLKVGNWRVEMLLRHSGRSRIVTASMTGSVEEGDSDSELLLSDVEAIPNELDFGTLDSSRPLVKSVIFRNVTSDPVQIKKVSIEAPAQAGYALSSDCDKLAVGQACISTITWAPVSKGQSDGVLIVEHDGPTRVASVNLRGSFEPENVTKAGIFPEAVPGVGLLISSQEEMDFGKITNEASMTISLVNVGEDALQLKDISLASEDTGLKIVHSGCITGSVLEPVEACPLTLAWSPVRSGELIEDIRIKHDGARGVLIIPVRGSADSAINRDTKAVVVSQTGSPSVEVKPADKRQALEGFIITSHSPKKAIINGPGGSRVISHKQSIVLGGVEWKVDIVENGIEFLSGNDRVRLLFDRSLSSASRTGATSSSSSSSSSSSGTASTATTTTTATTTN